MARVRITGHDDSATPAARGSGVEELSARAYTVPTDAPEADGTLSWEATTIVIANFLVFLTPAGLMKRG